MKVTYQDNITGVELETNKMNETDDCLTAEAVVRDRAMYVAERHRTFILIAKS